jgi:hypothetical protein
MSNRNYANGGKIHSMRGGLTIVDCNFVVDSTNGNGLGIRSLKGPLVKNVFMYTTATPAAGNPNPADGTIVVQLEDNFNSLLSGFEAIVSPVSALSVKIDNSILVPGIAYIITTLGDASVAKWQAIGVPSGVTPAVGVSFVATSDGGAANVSTSRVMTAAVLGSGICTIETVGDSNLSLHPDASKQQGFGGQIILQCRDFAGAAAAPVDGTVISLSFLLNNSGG